MISLKTFRLTICCLGLSILLGACTSTNNLNEKSVITFWNVKLNASFDQEDRFVKVLFPSLREVINIYSIPYYQLVFFSSEEALRNQKDLLSTDTEANGSGWVSCENVAVVFPNKYFDEFVEINEKEWCISESQDTTPPASDELESKAPSKAGVSNMLSYVNSVPHSASVQQFPLVLQNYRVLKEGIRGKMRLFEGDNVAYEFPELKGFTGFSAGANACSAYYWMIRWRSQNPDVELGAGTSSIPSEPGENIKWEDGQPLLGGAGFMEGRSCTTPYIFFERSINGNGATLGDVNYEILIWEYYPDI